LSAQHYRELMHECLGWAMTAKSPREHVTFMRMAAAWRHVVTIAEGQHDGHEPWRPIAALSVRENFTAG
jgi:hypothetical protein